MRIVALALDTYGDHVLRQPLLSGLLDGGHAVTLAMRPRYADIAPYLDARLAIIECDVDPSRRLDNDDAVWSTLQQALGRIRAAAPDLVVGLRYNRSAAEEWLLRNCTFSERLGFFPATAPDSLVDPLGLPANRKPALPFATTVTRALDAPEFSLEIAKKDVLFRSITNSSTPLPLPRLSPSPEDRSAAGEWIATTRIAECRYAVLAPAGTWNNPLKRMPPILAAAAIETLWRRHGLATVLTGVESERSHLDAVQSQVRGNRDHVVQWIGASGSLGTLLGLLAGAEAYVGADMGTMHFAGAVGIPVVALFGGGHFPRFQPAAVRWAAVTKRLPCFGCEWHCVYETPRCIEEVSVTTWMRAIDSVIEGQSPGWVLDPGGLDEAAARAAQPEFARIRGVLRAVENDRAERLTLLEVQDSQLHKLQAQLAEVEADRKKRLDALAAADRELGRRQQAINSLAARLSEGEARPPAIERDEAERSRVLARQDAELTALRAQIAEIEADRAKRLALIEHQHEELQTFRLRIADIEQDRAKRLALIERQDANLRMLEGRLDEVERDRAKRLTLIERQHVELDRVHLQLQESGQERDALKEQHTQLTSTLKSTEAGLAAQSDLATSLAKSLRDTAAELATSRQEVSRLRSRLAQASTRLANLQTIRGALRAIRNALLRKPKIDEGPEGT